MRLRLQAKYSLILLALIMVGVCALAGLLSWQFRTSVATLTQTSAEVMARDVREQMQQRGELMARFLADDLRQPLQQHRLTTMAILLSAIRKQPDVAYVYVYNAQGTILHDGTPDNAMAQTTPDNAVSRKAVATPALLVQATDTTLDIALPIWGDKALLGRVRLGLSLARLHANTASMATVLERLGWQGWQRYLGITGAITAVFLLCGIAVALSLAQRLIRPIRELANSAVRIGRGEYHGALAITRADELGDLARAFAEMRDNLQRTTISKQYLDNIVHSMTDTLAVVTPQGTIRLANQALCTLLGYTAEALVGQPLTRLFGAAEAHHATWLESVRQTGTNGSIDTTYVTQAGRAIPVAFAASLLRNETGAIQGIVCVAQDITARLQGQAALQHAKDAAEAANRTKSQFMAKMSHELRTPMNGVLGMAELLLGTTLTDRQRQFVRTVRHSGQALLAIINDILDFSKIEADRLELEQVDFDLRRTVEDVVELLAEGAHRKGLELVCQIQPDVPTTVQGDPVRFRQILTNLVGNAVKFTDSGEVVIQVTPDTVAEKTTVLRFTVRDTGVGITPEQQTRIFAPFMQADGSTTRKYGGTGLGLTIAKQLVEMMEGSIGVESLPDQGTTFWYTLRLGLHAAATLPALQPHVEWQGLHFLVVDDNATSRRWLHQQLTHWGLRGSRAASGLQALEKLRDASRLGKPYALVFVDLHMPVLDGLALIQALKAEAAIAAVQPVLLTTTPPSGGDLASWSTLVTHHIPKPVRQSQLYACLASITGLSVTLADSLSLQRSALPAAQAGQRWRVLLAEDNPVNQEVAQEMLAALGCQVDVVANGRSALDACAQTAYDLVFMDCQMPEMDGFAAARVMRAQEACGQGSGTPRRMPIVALTANAYASDRDACLAAGMDDYLSKPVTVEQLRAVLQRWLPALSAAPSSRQSLSLAVRSSAPASVAGGSQASQEGGMAPEKIAPPAGLIDTQTWEALRALQRQGGPDILGNVLRTYLKTAPPLLNTLRAALAGDDAPAVRQAAHSLKSSSANVGAVQLAVCCKELEAMGRANDLANAAAVLARLEAGYASVHTAFTTELATHPGPDAVAQP